MPIPLSPDRIAYRRKVGFVAAAAVVIGVPLYAFVLMNLQNASKANSIVPFSEKDGGKADDSRDLADAYRAVKRAVVEKMGPEYIRDLNWLEQHHEGQDGWYSIDGRVETSNKEGARMTFSFSAIAELDEDGNWNVSSVDGELME